MEMSREQWIGFYGKVWDILRDKASASKNPYDRERFVQTMLEDHHPCYEYRFGGSLGFGGKLWRYDGKLYVNYYPEDESTHTSQIAYVTNLKLDELQYKTIGGPIHGSPAEHQKMTTFLKEQQQEERENKMAKSATAETETTETKELSKAQKKALFDKYGKADAKMDAARKALDQAQAERSAAAGEIYEQLGKGPFKYNGVVVKLVKRESKERNEDGTPVWTTYFFRGPKQADVEEID